MILTAENRNTQKPSTFSPCPPQIPVSAVGQNPRLGKAKLAVSRLNYVTTIIDIKEIDCEAGSWMGLILGCVHSRALILALLNLGVFLSDDRRFKLGSLLVNKTQQATYCV